MILLIVNVVHKFHDSYKHYNVELFRKAYNNRASLLTYI